MTLFGQSFNEILEHGAKASCDLNAFRPTKAYFSARKVHKVLPIWRWENDAQSPDSVAYYFVAQLPAAHPAQQPVKLIDDKNGGRWIVDRL